MTAQITITVKPVQVLKVPGGTISFSLQEGGVLYAPNQGDGGATNTGSSDFGEWLVAVFKWFFNALPSILDYLFAWCNAILDLLGVGDSSTKPKDKPLPPPPPPVTPPKPTTATLTISYNGNENTHGSVPTSHTVTTPGNITLKQPGNMLKWSYLFGGWKDAEGTVRQPGTYYHSTAQSGTRTQTAVWNKVKLITVHPTIPGAPRGPYATADAAAIAWSDYIYSSALYIRCEFSAVIYKDASNQYWLTATEMGQPTDLVPTNCTRVAYVHTHTDSIHFSPQDIKVSRDFFVNGYVTGETMTGSKTFYLARHNYPSGTIENVSASITLRSLSETVRTELASLYQGMWLGHLPCAKGWDCGNMQWPTYPWPPA